MARIRSIKPGFFTSEDVAELSLRARLTWIGLWCYCDDFGRGKANLKLIKAAVWPLDPVTLEDVRDDLQELAAAGRIVLYAADGGRFLEITNWAEHQHPNRPAKASKFPAPVAPWIPPPGSSDARVNGHGALSESSLNGHGALSESPGYPQGGPFESGTQRATEHSVSLHGALTPGEERRGEGGEGNAHTREEPPRPTCKRHPNGNPQDEPCRGCAAITTWDREHETRQRERTRRDAIARLQNCPDCHGGTWLDNGTKCTHPRSRGLTLLDGGNR